ncbi:MAG: metalloregulator ArsR/SmtB family transcription factor [Steroidobacteraceae bacterium]|nr:metalloregulator ArsR/SmtB family transcription factor [Steroidobacteraceae bacterium]MDW8257923.1 metalloregulator ArsR/SmtB family transcription factor [Gammaproteobacteria bacterium]
MTIEVDPVRQLAALGQATRLRLTVLCAEGPAQVGQLAAALQLPESTVSRHLQRLHTAGLLQRHVFGREVHYRLTEHARKTAWLAHCMDLAQAADPRCRTALARLRRSGHLKAAQRSGEGSVLGQRLVAALDALGDSAAPRVRALLFEPTHVELLSWCAERGGAPAVLLRDRSARRALRAWCAAQGLDAVWLTLAALKAHRRWERQFDRIVATPADTEELRIFLPCARRALTADGQLLLAMVYDALESPNDSSGAPHPLLRLRAALTAADLDCERLVPIDIDGQHLLLASGRPRRSRLESAS